MLSGEEVPVGILPSPTGRGGGEGPNVRNSPTGGLTSALPSPQTPLPMGEGLYAPPA